MTSTNARPRWRRPLHASRRGDRGVVLLVTLLALVIMLLGAVALLRSFSASTTLAGNLAFKRDLVNQAERAAVVAMATLQTGALAGEAARAAHLQASNYRASMLPTNDQGIPLALLSDAAFTAVASTANDIVVAEQAVRLRWVLDRLCTDPGTELALGTDRCTVGPTPDARGGSASDPIVATQQPQVLYRLSIRVDGPRNTQAFFQTTLAL